jgi:hypothetical protein
MPFRSQRLVLSGQRVLDFETGECPDGRGEHLDKLSRLRRQTLRGKYPTANSLRRDLPKKNHGKKMATKKKSKTSKRTVIEPKKGDRRYVRRNKKGEFKKEVKVGKSLAADRKRKAKTKVEKGQGDRGDVKR